MIGLILKDIYTLKSQAKIYLILAIVYGIYGAAVGDITFIFSVITMMSAMLPITLMAYDERSKWDKYCITMPVSRKSIVLSKYILSFSCLGIILLVTEIFTIISEGISIEAIMMPICICSVGVFFISVLMSIIIKLGVEKSRLLMMLVFFIPAAIVVFVSKLEILHMNSDTVEKIVMLSPVAVIAIAILSMYISVKLYINKEL